MSERRGSLPASRHYGILCAPHVLSPMVSDGPGFEIQDPPSRICDPLNAPLVLFPIPYSLLPIAYSLPSDNQA